MDDLDHPAFIEEWKQNLDTAAYKKILYTDVELPSIKKKLIVMIKHNTGQNS